MPDLGLGTLIVIDPPAAPTFKVAPPTPPNLLAVPGPQGVPGTSSDADLMTAINLILAGITSIQETLMAYNPTSSDVTKITGAVILVASSATSVQLTAGRAHEVTGSAAQTFTAPTSPTNGMIVNVKVAEAYTGAGVTMPTGMQQAGVLTAGQDYTWQNDGTNWNIQ